MTAPYRSPDFHDLAFQLGSEMHAVATTKKRLAAIEDLANAAGRDRALADLAPVVEIADQIGKRATVVRSWTKAFIAFGEPPKTWSVLGRELAKTLSQLPSVTGSKEELPRGLARKLSNAPREVTDRVASAWLNGYNEVLNPTRREAIRRAAAASDPKNVNPSIFSDGPPPVPRRTPKPHNWVPEAGRILSELNLPEGLGNVAEAEQAARTAARDLQAELDVAPELMKELRTLEANAAQTKAAIATQQRGFLRSSLAATQRDTDLGLNVANSGVGTPSSVVVKAFGSPAIGI